ncbi:MAG TPA: YciI family protein [Anaerolineales bacterium]|nr:YciI family protein [Anaerolineales bacterium]
MSQNFPILHTPGPAFLQGKSIFEQPLFEHGEYWKMQFDAGKLRFGGPFTDHSGGAVVIEVMDEAEARQILAQDPAISDEVFIGRLFPWYLVDWERYGSKPHE